jgi:dolichyl-phosphate-mannose--protein O-mannosyl transferase
MEPHVPLLVAAPDFQPPEQIVSRYSLEIGQVRSYVLPLLLFGGALLLYLPRLEVPGAYMYDEAYHAFTAGQYLAGNPDAFVWSTPAPRPGVGYTWNHPPAGLLLIAAGIAIQGDNPRGWRISSALFGALGILAAYLLALRLSRDREVAQLTAALLLVDGLYFVQSRTSMLDIFGTVFMMGALLCLYAYLVAPADQVRRPLLLTGVCLGLAIATKWNAAYPAALIGLVAVCRALDLWRLGRVGSSAGRQEDRAGLRQHLLWVPLGLVVVPAAVYLAAYIPFFLTGHDWPQFVELQRQIYSYHTSLKATHGYQSQWWQWPLALRPVWYHVRYSAGATANIYAQGNPLLYWAFIPAVLWLSYRWWKARHPGLVVLLIGFFGQWLPWGLVPRAAFMYHFLPAVPFGALAVAAGLVELWRHGISRQVLAAAYVLAVALSFVYFYPLYAAVPLEKPALESRMWLEGWR